MLSVAQNFPFVAGRPLEDSNPSAFAPILGFYIALHDIARDYHSREFHFIITLLLLFIFRRMPNELKVSSNYVLRPIKIFIFLSLLTTAISFVIYMNDVTLDWIYNTVKVLWYSARLPIYFLFGLAIGLRVRSTYVIVDALVIAGLIEALQFIIRYILDPNLAVADRFYIRSEIGHGGFVIPLAMLAAGFRLLTSKLNFTWSHFLALAILPIAIIEIILSQSRTAIVATVVLVMFSTKLFPLKFFSRITIPVILVMGVILTTPFIYEIIPEDNLRQIIYSVPEFVNELIAIDRTGLDYEINNYWRGYETYLAFTFVEEAGIIQIIFGTGLHTVVLLPKTLDAGNLMISELPIFHNGFSFAFVRGGLVGIVLYILQYVKFAEISATTARASNLGTRLIGNLACGTLLLTTLAMPTTSGMLNFDEGGSTPCLLMGIAWSFYYRHIVRTNLQNREAPESEEML
jgi:hypothetical protein